MEQWYILNNFSTLDIIDDIYTHTHIHMYIFLAIAVKAF